MRHAVRPAAAGSGEAGWTLVEVVVLVAVVAIVATCGGLTLAQRPAQAATTARAFAGLVTEARALASVTGDGAAGTGASIGVVRDGRDYVATLYTYRPMPGAAHAPAVTSNVPPLRTTTRLAVVGADGIRDAPFAIFFSASGHAVAQAPFTVGVDAPLAAEPNCPPETGILIAFIDGVHDQIHALTCEVAQLDLDTVRAAAPGR